MMSKYSTKIADAIQEFLHDDDWNFTFREEKGTFHFSLSTRSRLNTVDYFIAVREDHYRVLCISPLNVNTDDAQELARMAEFITRANYGMTRCTRALPDSMNSGLLRTSRIESNKRAYGSVWKPPAVHT